MKRPSERRASKPASERGTVKRPGVPAARATFARAELSAAADPAARRAALALWVALVLLVLARAALAFVPSMYGWGLNLQRFLAPGAGWVLWILLAATCVPALGAFAGRAFEPPDRAFGARGLVGSTAALAAAVAIVGALPDRAWFLGDFILRQGAISTGHFDELFIQSLPLDTLLHKVLPLTLLGRAEEAVSAYGHGLGLIEAALFGLAAMAVARSLSGGRGSPLLACTVLLCGGYLAMFTGFSRSASEQALLTLVLGWGGLRLVRRGEGAVGFGVTLALALVLHRSMLVLLPAAGYAGWRWLRSARRRPWWEWAALLLPVAAVLAVLPRLARVVTSFDVPHHLRPGGAGSMLAAAIAPLHLLDLFGAVCVLSPVAVPVLLAVLVLGRMGPRSPEGRYLTILAGAFVLLMLFVHPQQGLFRDWDVFAPAGVGLSLWSAWALREVLPRGPARQRLALAVMMAAFVPSLELLLLHHDVDRSLARVAAFMTEPPPRDPAERSKTWDYLGVRNYRLARWDAAASAFARAAETQPTPRMLVQWALAEAERGNLEGAADVFRRAIARDPESPFLRLGLANVAARLGHLAEARGALEEVLRRYPDNQQVRSRLAEIERLEARRDSLSAAGRAR